MEKPKIAPKFWRELATACRFGAVEPEVVQAWFDLKWPVYQTYGYRAHKRAIAKWWGRVALREIEEAREFIQAKLDLAEAERLEELALECNREAPPRRRLAARAFTVIERG